jgi:hypothetical protein
VGLCSITVPYHTWRLNPIWDTTHPNLDKWHFILWTLVERTKDSNNVTGREQKFVYSTFTLEANGQCTTLSKMLTWQYFLWVLVPRTCPVEA